MNRKTLIFIALSLAAPARAEPPADVQFFGDVFVPAKVLAVTEPFADAQALLGAAVHNVANLEGAITTAAVPYEPKRFLLRMPISAAGVLKAAGVDAVTLANNHSLDFGSLGLFDTLDALTKAGIAAAGAGKDRDTAERPLLLPVHGGTLCLIAYSRVLPESFWATDEHAGTAFADEGRLQRNVKACVDSGLFTVVAFHWGREMMSRPMAYQRDLAHRAIDAGARLIIGHHPHILQGMEIYKDRPIFYSLGNFAFGSSPLANEPEGIAVRLSLPGGVTGKEQIEIVPLAVHNTRVHFRPRPLAEGEGNPFKRYVAKIDACGWDQANGHWSCLF